MFWLALKMSAALEASKCDPALLRGRVGAALDALSKQEGVSIRQLAAIDFCFGGFAVLEFAREGAKLATVESLPWSSHNPSASTG